LLSGPKNNEKIMESKYSSGNPVCNSILTPHPPPGWVNLKLGSGINDLVGALILAQKPGTLGHVWDKLIFM
jgi:hypothetical protein